MDTLILVRDDRSKHGHGGQHCNAWCIHVSTCGALSGAGLRMAQLLQELRGMFIVFTVVDMRHQRILLMSNMENLSVVPDTASSSVARKCAVGSALPSWITKHVVGC